MTKVVTKLLGAMLLMMAFIFVSPVSSANADSLVCNVTETMPCIETIDQGDTLTARFDTGLELAQVDFTNQSFSFNAEVNVQDHPPVFIQVQQTVPEVYPVYGTQALTFTNLSLNPQTPVRLFITGKQYS
ncbi:hypothetical protein [Okeania sp. SIO1I7]|uniref:hypothetical protein n=1 Tax=Okeania sp. SIO1I7 TaxID=2607772 RepID=UPI0013FCC062|nr:hypothetical protein [Okeania sp. SIO1I7]NET26146.1 hypothetical protein [Okeania sp. SIO1I7]